MLVSNQFSTPPVVKNLLIINALFFLAVSVLPAGTVDLIYARLALFFWKSPFFMPHQVVTYMFLHAGFSHFFFNMFALWMFGRVLEYDLGSRRFLIFYMVCGIGAALLQLGVAWFELSGMEEAVRNGTVSVAQFASRVNVPTVGASGAIFGILLGFGMLHPNSIIMLLFPPIPMKAKYFVIIYGVIELMLGVSGRMDNVAHFAHVGGMLWGWMLLRWWKKRGTLYY
ncbi:MAG: rhomboid family intramembrane serine protease [Rikenellaceae bacterium]|nr:rhomboid family intramembrane serine protease [Rikenellaceae bacterium]